MINKHTSFSIDVMRGMSALGVIWGHSVFPKPFDLSGAFWVWIFLGISGYLVGKSFMTARYPVSINGYMCFLWNRSLRIMPLFWFGCLLGLMFEMTGVDKTLVNGTSSLNAVKQFLFMSDDMTLSGPLWTVSAEIKFYAISIIIIYIIGKIRHMPIYLLFLLLFMAIAQVYQQYFVDNKVQPRTLFGNIHFFVFGLILATGRFDLPFKISRFLKVGLVVAGVILALYLNNYFPEYFWRKPLGDSRWEFVIKWMIPCGYASFIALFIVYITVCTLVKENEKINRFYSRCIRFLAYCGFYTYGIYVWHAILSKADHVFFNISYGFTMLFYLLLSLPLAFFSYKYFEEPLLRFRKGERSINSVYDRSTKNLIEKR